MHKGYCSLLNQNIFLMNYLNNAKELYQLIGEGKAMEAFEKYYHDDVVMIEANGDARKGKDENRKYEEQFFSTIKEYHDGGVYAMTSDENGGVTMVETWMDITFNDGKRVKMEQVAVQYWKDDQIIRERFYYNS